MPALKILMVNKFLFPNGGSESYMFKLGDYLVDTGHQVEYFGMADEAQTVGNKAMSYTKKIDFHSGRLARLLYPFKIIYSFEARRKIRRVLADFDPDAVHLNNFNFQLTPSILYEIKKYATANKKMIRIIYTAHDYQLVCPNHMLKNPRTEKICEECLGGSFGKCTRNRCIHGSGLRSILGSLEAYLYQLLQTYRLLDTIICPSVFMQKKLQSYPLLAERTLVMPNFANLIQLKEVRKEDYVLYFGRYSVEKGFRTLLEACRKLPDIPFVFAGKGPLEEELVGISNVKNLGFLTGEQLAELVRKARFSVYPSEWYENCPLSVIESQMYGTPVLGADIGGIPELIEAGRTGELFRSADSLDLQKKIKQLWQDRAESERMAQNCRQACFNTVDQYCTRLLEIYQGRGGA